MHISRTPFVLLTCLAAMTAQAQQSQIDPRLYQLFTPVTFYHSGAAQRFAMSDDTDAVGQEVNRTLMNIYLNRPDLVTATETEIKAGGELRQDIIKPAKQVKQKVKLTDEAAPAPEADDVFGAPLSLVVEKPNFWKFRGDGYLQFLQNYVSDNWYKGGESNYSTVAALTLEANYDNQQRLKWENKLEMKLGFQTSKSDSVHRFKTNNDQIRYTGKLGLKASTHWYYTLQLLAETQFMPGHKSNDERTYSDFLSPLKMNLGLGMDYKYESKNKRFNTAVNLSPLSVSYRSVKRENLATSFGIDEGHTHKTDLGSQITANATWKLNDVVTWKSRFYFFTSYKRCEAEWENTFELKVSRYISANIFIFPRFDDANNRDDKLGYFQFKEYSSLGFNYSF